jgi:hypothetical protein
VAGTDQRTPRDGAHPRPDRVEVRQPAAERIVRVMEQRKTPPPGALSEAVPPAAATRLAATREIPAPPPPGRGRTRAERAGRVVRRPCLERRFSDAAARPTAVAAWDHPRQAAGGTVNWRFTTDDTRSKLKRLYPSL